MKICIFGNKSSTSELIKYLINNDIQIDTLVCVDDTVLSKNIISGLDENLSNNAIKLGLKTFLVSNYSLSSEVDYKFFKQNKFDLGFSTGWQRIIPSRILQKFKYGVFGWHGSGFKLPNGRGRSPLNWSIRLGLNNIYHNCFRYGSGIDDGEIFDTEKININKDDHILDLQHKVLKHIKKSSISLIKDIKSDRLILKKQAQHPFIFFPKLDENSGHINPNLISCNDAMNIIRSCSKPFPGAFLRLKENRGRIKIWDAIMQNKKSKNMVGKIKLNKNYFFLSFYDGTLKVTSFELEFNKDILFEGNYFDLI